ncbi:hypothetical protein AAG720_000731 [Escherichia coli]|uniref:hypothetical protein n=1 Tax=Escherichia coli TaxID=562 RepID=UPI0005304C05|nr:hypothetical protein [Escherichia coli]EFA8840314.1 hypothetical protein [Escherichia coli O88:H4]EEZ4416912.1 hypothetical protein [Escherichia coli]EEZ5265953.1 hypothetical protein [Escherichia coli]EEZ9094272.1 hypothetical protein [Escherichia coli]EFC6420162.1 hypothetical protein [Escherichia coli]
MNKKLLAMGLLLSMTAGSAMAAANSGTTIGTGTLAVTGTVGTSTCSVTFPQSVTMPSITTALYNTTPTGSAMIQQSAGNIQFSGCNGQSVNLKVMANNVTLAGSKTIGYPKVDDRQQGWLGLAFAVSTDNGSSFNNLKLDNSPSEPISVTSEAFALPVRVKAVKLSSNTATDIGQGNYSASFVVTATYA